MRDAEASGATSPTPVDGTTLAAATQALRARAASRVDAVRLRVLEALKRRGAGLDDAVRRTLDDKATALATAWLADAAVDPAVDDTQCRIDDGMPHRSALAELVSRLGRPASTIPARAGPTRSQDVSSVPASPAELETLAYFRRTWSRLSADQRVAESLSTLPENAGPLNSHHLVHRSLSAMREVSPEYLERFIAHVDALLWLDLANEGAIADAAPAARVEGGRKPPRGR